MAEATAAEMGLQGWRVEGWRQFGATYGKALAYAAQEMTRALERGLDPITHEVRPAADPVGALERIVYDLLVIAVEGLPTVAEMPPLEETSWPVESRPPRREVLITILHDFLMATDEARLTVDGVAYAAVPGYGVHTWSSPVLMRAAERIEAVA